MKDLLCEARSDGFVLRLTIVADMPPATARQRLAEIDLDAAQVQAVLTNIARARAMMKDKVPEKLEGEKLHFHDITERPPAIVGSSGKNALLALRHAGFGWLCFAMPHQGAAVLGNSLIMEATKMARQAPLVLPPGKLNG